jgi:hypothetical protein
MRIQPIIRHFCSLNGVSSFILTLDVLDSLFFDISKTVLLKANVANLISESLLVNEGKVHADSDQVTLGAVVSFNVVIV